MTKFTQRQIEEIADFTALEIFSIVPEKETQDAILDRLVYFLNAENMTFHALTFADNVKVTAAEHGYREAEVNE
jgi:hypothetical protein